MIRNRLLEFVRRRCGYRFPRAGRVLFDLTVRFAPAIVQTELFPGIHTQLNLADEVQRATYWQGERFEAPTLALLRQWTEEGSTHFFDVGSNYGFFTFAILSSHPQLRVHAFEPNPATFAHLNETKAQNHLDRLTAWNLGLADRSGSLQLRHGKVDSGHSTFGEHPELDANGRDLIEVVDFETWRTHAKLEFHQPQTWIAKIDVEGFEMKVLAGMQAALERRAFHGLVVEINDFTLGFCGTRREEIYGYMDNLGYEALTKRRDATRIPFMGNEFFVPR